MTFNIKYYLIKFYNHIRHTYMIYNAKKNFLKKIFIKLDIVNIKKIEIIGQGFCDTFIIYANKNFIIKKHNENKFQYFKNNFSKYEPIYKFLNYHERFTHEKKYFKLFNNLDTYILADTIIFPYIESKPLSYYLYNDIFFLYLKNSILMLLKYKKSHGDFHIDNILISPNNKIYFIDFEMVFSNYIKEDEQMYYDIYFLFAKLEYKYNTFFQQNRDKLKKLVNQILSSKEKDTIVSIVNNTYKYFNSINGANLELFKT